MKKKVIGPILCFVFIIVAAFGTLCIIDHHRMDNNEPVLFSTWGKQYVPPVNDYPLENGENSDEFQYPLGVKEYKNSFVGKVIEETTSYMIVEPVKDKADGDMGDKVKVEYGTDHYDYLFGEGRMVVIYFEGKPEETTDGMKFVKSDDISTEGFREFELEVEPSSEKQKRLALSGDDIQSFVSFGHMSDTNLYYYGLDKVMITIKGFTMPLETALEKGRITLDGIVANCNMDVMNGVLEELVYKDGGSQVYKYPDYTIIKYHTLDGNRDVYIGSTDMDINIADK